MFGKIFSTDMDLCRELLELILGIKIREVRLTERQKSIEITVHNRGVRLDVYVEDESNTIYDIEMQTANTHNLPKRSRYYQGMIDLNLIERGADFDELNRSYVIFILLEDFDKAHRNLPFYTFTNICREDKSYELDDETTRIFVNTACTRPDLPEQVKAFFEFVQKNKASTDFTKRCSEAVSNGITNQKWRLEYMTLEMKFREIRKEALEEGKAEGIAEGIIQTYVTLIKDGVFSLEQAAELSGISAEKLAKALSTAEN